MATREVKIGSFALGVNNKLEPSELDVVLPDRSKGQYLYGGDNIDIGRKGRVKRRAGTTQLIEARTHSVWSDSPYSEAFAVINDQLERLVESVGLSRTVVRTGMPRLPVSYSRGADGDVYWSNGVVLRRIVNGVDHPAHTEPFEQAPQTAVGTGGALVAAQYLICFTRVTVDGESPATQVVALDVPAGGTIAWLASEEAHVYLSGPNGDVLTLQDVGTAGTIFTHNERSYRCETILTQSMPAGTIVRHYNSRLLVAAGRTLHASKQYHYGVCDPRRDYFQFSADITMVEPTDNGLYLATTERTYWISDLYDDKLQEVLPYGAIPYTSGRSPDDEQVYWQSTRGLVVGDKNMSVKNVQEDALEVPPAASGATLYRERDGMTHVVSTRADSAVSVGIATTWMDADVIRKGTEL